MAIKVDIHCHVDLYSNAELDSIFENEDFIVVGAATGYESGNRLLQLAGLYQKLKVCLGIHPEYHDGFSDIEKVAAQIEENLDKIIAVGEVGLPYYSLKKMSAKKKAATSKSAKQLLVKFMALAKKFELPVILHAIENTTSFVLDELGKNQISKALFHWFEGNDNDLQRIIDRGYTISVSPDAIYNQQYAEFTDQIPLDILTLESDGPWEYNGIRGNPAMIEDTAAFLAERRGLQSQDILSASYSNCLKLLGSKGLG